MSVIQKMSIFSKNKASETAQKDVHQDENPQISDSRGDKVVEKTAQYIENQINSAGNAADAENQRKNEIITADDVKELSPLYDNVVLALKQVYDPEIPVNIYDLGLIYELNINKSHEVYIKMTFTAPNCPMADEVLAEVQRSVEDAPGVKSVKIDLVFEPVWDMSMLSDEARVELGMDEEF